MKLIDGIKLTGKPVEIPDCSRNDLPELFIQLGLKWGVEIGVFEGEYTEVLAKSVLKVWGIDPWLAYDGYAYEKEQYLQDKRYQRATDRLSKYRNVEIIRKTSMEAIKEFADNSLDFVYIDANHRFKYVAEDICEWEKKVKTGGIICGHDYAYFRHRFPGGGCQVKEVVDAFVKSYDLNFWVLGRRNKVEGEKRDDYRSWMILKTWKNQ